MKYVFERFATNWHDSCESCELNIPYKFAIHVTRVLTESSNRIGLIGCRRSHGALRCNHIIHAATICLKETEALLLRWRIAE